MAFNATMAKQQIPLLFVLALAGCSEKEPDNKESKTNDRWYTQSQVDAGRIAFEKHCAQCHGNDAQGTLKWMDALPDGTYPPPPLNGTAHAWHHPLNALRRTVYFGGVRLGGTMPAFKDTLNNEDIDTVIAYFQSKWDKKIYDAWIDRGGLK